jgi:hypothetical protein
MKLEQTEYSKMLAYKIQMLRNYPEESIQQKKKSFIRGRKNRIQMANMITSLDGEEKIQTRFWWETQNKQIRCKIQALITEY